MQPIQATVVGAQPIQAAIVMQPTAAGDPALTYMQPTAAGNPALTAGGPSTARFDLGLDLMEKTPKVVPPEVQSMGVDQKHWDKWGQDIEAGKRDNPFYSCPWCETCYWCFPLLCIQTMLCLLNPCSWWLISRSRFGLNRTKNAINSDIENEQKMNPSYQDLHFGWKEGFSSITGVFYKGPKPEDLP